MMPLGVCVCMYARVCVLTCILSNDHQASCVGARRQRAAAHRQLEQLLPPPCSPSSAPLLPSTMPSQPTTTRHAQARGSSCANKNTRHVTTAKGWHCRRHALTQLACRQHHHPPVQRPPRPQRFRPPQHLSPLLLRFSAVISFPLFCYAFRLL